MYYHVWFATKYRKRVLSGKFDRLVKHVILECAERHDIKIEEFETDLDHIHILVEACGQKELSSIIRIIKSVSAKEALLEIRKNGTKQKNFWARRFNFREYYKEEIQPIKKYILEQKK